MRAPDHAPRPAEGLTRRAVLVGGAATLALMGCTDGGSTERRTAGPTTTAAAGGREPGVPLRSADFEPLGTCRLTPEAIAGPFPLDEQFLRRDITEGRPGHPMRLGLRVVDGDCVPVPESVVEVWHVDATGDYSAFADGGDGKDEADGTTFLRGSQVAGDDGITEFLTIYPGWYSGRAVHIHLRVHVDETIVLTTQLYFDEAYTERVHASGAYAPFGRADTSIDADGLAGDVRSDGTMLATSSATTDLGPGTLALLNLGVAGA